MKIHLMACGLTIVMAALSAEGNPILYGGICFPNGGASFADRVVSTTPGDPGPTDANFVTPETTLGFPDYTGGASGSGAYTLGVGGSIVVQFHDNLLVGDGTPAADLHIFEVGPDVEDTFVEISTDGVNFIPIGKVAGAVSAIDIDPFLAATPNRVFRFVKLTDDPAAGGTTGKTPGADIDAVGAIGSRKPTVAECMTTANGMKASLVPFLARIANEHIDLFMVFDGCVVPGYEYDLEFSADLKNWFKVNSPDVGDFVLQPDGRYELEFRIEGPLWRFIDADKAKKNGHIRLVVREPNDPGGG